MSKFFRAEIEDKDYSILCSNYGEKYQPSDINFFMRGYVGHVKVKKTCTDEEASIAYRVVVNNKPLNGIDFVLIKELEY